MGGPTAVVCRIVPRLGARCFNGSADTPAFHAHRRRFHAIIAGQINQSDADMLDPNLLRQQPADLAVQLRETRGYDLDADALAALETERKQIQVRTQELQNLRNTRSKAIGQAKAKGEDVAPLLAEVAGFGDELKASEARLDAIKAELDAIALGLPNLPHESVPAGKDEADNVEQHR